MRIHNRIDPIRATCPACGRNSSPRLTRCLYCGSELSADPAVKVLCPQCGAEKVSSSQCCPACFEERHFLSKLWTEPGWLDASPLGVPFLGFCLLGSGAVFLLSVHLPLSLSARAGIGAAVLIAALVASLLRHSENLEARSMAQLVLGFFAPLGVTAAALLVVAMASTPPLAALLMGTLVTGFFLRALWIS